MTHTNCKVVINEAIYKNSPFRPNLPITESVIQEILRSSCIAPLGIPHYCEHDISLNGGKILIPAGTMMMPNLFNIVNDPEQFPEPEKFNPDRFLDENGKYVKHDHNIVFSTGNKMMTRQILLIECSEQNPLGKPN
jgi:cytochrome P450 family 2 subfamily J